VSSLDHGLQILELLGERRELKLVEVATLVGVSRPTAFRLLVALEAKGYVEHVKREHVYRLGQAVHVLAARAEPASLVRLAEPALSEIGALSGETTNLALVHRTSIVYAAIVEGTYALRMSATVGEAVPPHATALGKAILSRLSVQAVDSFLGPGSLERFTEHTIVDRARFAAVLDEVRERGYATDDGECETGALCIAAPIVAQDGYPVGGISVSGLAARISPEQRTDLGETIRAWCEQLSKQVGDGRVSRDAPERG
jgi:IclR family acetate operon transcriptional repressor